MTDRTEAEVVVIGTGAGAAPLAARLAARGVRVVLLEAGGRTDPLHHTPDETASAPLYWTEERLSGGADPTAFGANNSGIGVGGSTLHWGAFVPRPDGRDLHLARDFGVGRDWPFGIDVLAPYLAEVERTLGVSGPDPYPWDAGRHYPLPPPQRNGPADAMARGAAACGLTTADAPAALVTRDRTGGAATRHACVNCGSCHQGCRTGAKASMDVTFLAQAVRDGARIVTGARAVGFERAADGRLSAVIYARGGALHRIAAGRVVLSAGGIETPRLMLHADIGTASGQVGRNFMAHGAVQVWGRFDGAPGAGMRMNRGYPSSLICEDMLRPPDAGFAGGYLIQSLGVQPVTLAETLTRGGGLWGRDLMRAIDGYNGLAGLGINGECLPDAANRLTLSGETDAFGVPKAHVAFSMGDNERAMADHAVRTLTAIWEAAGATDIRRADRTAHTIGTCRMGIDPGDSVVDADGRSHEIANLWICDNSVFPSALAANPALTIMALSLRCADRMAAA